MSRKKLTVLITTFNESEFIEECIRSVEWADEVYLIDSNSTDTTLEIVRGKFPKVRIEVREYLGAAAQKNHGIDHASNDWVFVIDADERVSPDLRYEILEILNGQPDYWAYTVYRLNFILGKQVSWGNMGRDHVTRLFHKKHARYPNKRVHADMLVEGPIGVLNARLVHFYVRSFQHMAARMQRYAYWNAAQKFVEGKRCGLGPIVTNSLWRFFRDYFLFGGFLDGRLGIVVAGMESYYTFLKYLYLWEYTLLEKQNKPIALPDFDTQKEIWQNPWQQQGEERRKKSPSRRLIGHL